MRLSAPTTYHWKFSFAYERFKRDPLDYVVLLVFISHCLGFAGLLVYLKVQSSKKKLFVYHK